MIAVGRVLLLRQPEAEGGIGNQFLVQWLEEAGALQSQRLGDLLFKRLPQGRAGDAL